MMDLYIIRHGDPQYSPDQLTPKGRRQAEAVARRLSVYGLDRIFSSPNGRAQETAQPTCEILKLQPEIEDWMSEDHAFRTFSIDNGRGGREWVFNGRRAQMYLPENCEMPRDRWYDVPVFADMPLVQEGYARIQAASDDFTARLGFVRRGQRYEAAGEHPRRVAAFCHQGFGLTWISHLLAVPPQLVWRGMDVCHSSMTVFRFAEDTDGLWSARLLTLSDTPHIYADRLPLRHGNAIEI